MDIRPYTGAFGAEWDALVDASRNGTFLFRRAYMDYHADRFRDCSLVALDDRGRPVALLPACIDGTTVTSHAGLTYGGWILGPKSPDMLGMMRLWPAMIDYYRSLGATELIYRPVPHIYHRYPSEEDLYALFRHGATLDRVLISSAVDLRHPVACSSTVRRHTNKCHREGVTISLSEDLARFWEILETRLEERYAASPVHSLTEMQRLMALFPDNIHLYIATSAAGELLGGLLVYICGKVVKCQYGASSPLGREYHVTDMLNAELISRFSAAGYHYFDIGTANEDGGKILNEGLISQKISYGGRGIAYTSYRQPLL